VPRFSALADRFIRGFPPRGEIVDEFRRVANLTEAAEAFAAYPSGIRFGCCRARVTFPGWLEVFTIPGDRQRRYISVAGPSVPSPDRQDPYPQLLFVSIFVRDQERSLRFCGPAWMY